MGADVLDHRQAVADLSFLDGEAGLGAVDVGRQHIDVATVAVEDRSRHLVIVAGFVVEQGRQVLEWIVGLEVGRLIRDHGISGAVRLVEPVPGEERHQVEDVGRLRLGHAPVDRAGDELGAHFCHLVFLLLAHRGAQHVRLTQAEARQLGRDLHHLLLVDDHAVGLFEDGFQLRERVDDLLLATLALHVLVDEATLERPGPKQRDGRGDVLEARRPHVLQQPAQPRGLQLEHAVRVGRLQQPEGRGIVPGDLPEIEPEAARLLEILESVLDDREVA